MALSLAELQVVMPNLAERLGNNNDENNISWFANLDFKKDAIHDLPFRDLEVSDGYRVDFSMTNEDYHKTDYLSSSRLKSVFKSERHYIDYFKNQSIRKPSNSMLKGTAIHQVFEDIVRQRCNSKGSCLAMWKPIHKTTIKPEQYECTQELTDIIKALLEEIERYNLYDLLYYAIPELSIFDEVGKEKVRPDLFIPSEIYGYGLHLAIKTVSSVERFKYQIRDYGYDLSCGMYNHHLREMTNRHVVTVFLIVDMSNGMIQFKEVSENTMDLWIEKYHTAKSMIENIDLTNPKGYNIEVI